MRYQKKKNVGTNGFTLMELIICIAIMAVLIAIAVPVFINQKEKSEQTVLLYNTRALKDMIMASTLDYSKGKWYGNWNQDLQESWEYGDGTLNNYIKFNQPSQQKDVNIRL